ncbi:MAG TPA: metal ABC transporter permease [bacterium]|nr:metal ABC transporter permease [bacterium]
MFDDFIWRALLGGIGVAVVAGPLGCFVVWRRMAYFGDALAHGALLGVALGFALDMNLNASTLLAFVVFTLALASLQAQRRLATDTLLGILSHAALALGLVTISFMERLRVDLMGYLFGDILAVTRTDLLWIYGGGVLILAVMVLLWSRLVSITVHEELARAEGLPVGTLRLVLMLLIALVIVAAMKIIGILLITALLIIPAAAARTFARSPEQMAVLASALGALAVLGGLGASLRWDTPSGPSVVVCAAVLFALTLAAESGWRRLRHAT